MEQVVSRSHPPAETLKNQAKKIDQTNQSDPTSSELWKIVKAHSNQGNAESRKRQLKYGSVDHGVAQTVKNLPAMHESQVQPLGQEDPLKKRMAAYPLQYSCLETSMDRGTVHRVAKRHN